MLRVEVAVPDLKEKLVNQEGNSCFGDYQQLNLNRQLYQNFKRVPEQAVKSIDLICSSLLVHSILPGG